jgi:hypothetical protein
MTSGLAMAQTIITIDNSSQSTATYQTIQDALDNATAGDIIYVQPTGTSYGAAIIDTPITIVGRSHSENNNISTIDAITIRSSNVTIKGIAFNSLYHQTSGSPNTPPFSNLRVYESKFSNATFGEFQASPTADDIEIRGCVFNSFQQYPDATNILIANNILVSTSPFTVYDPSTLVIANNNFRSTNNFTLSNQSTSETCILFNNLFTTNYQVDATISFSTGDFNLSNNLTYNYNTSFNLTLVTSGTGTFLDSNTLLNTDPLFTNIDTTIAQSFAGYSTYNPSIRLEDDLSLQAGSPALTGGGGGSEMGLFNNGFIYKKLGNPRGVPTLDVLGYDGAVPKNGTINVTINAKAN